MKISIIIPVLHEGDRINTLIDSLYKIRGTYEIEIIVVDGDENGSTIAHVKDKSIISITAARGRAGQMNAGATHAGGDILLFLHADTVLPANAFDCIIDALGPGRYSAGAFSLSFDSEKIIMKIITKAARLRMSLTGIPFGDQAFFFKRKYFNSIGGFSDIPLMEDVEIMKRIKKRGGKIIIVQEKIITSPRMWEEQGVFFTIFRNYTLQFLYMCGVSPSKLVKWYYRK